MGTKNWAFIGDHVSTFQITGNLEDIMLKDHVYPENNGYDFGVCFNQEDSPQFICYDDLLDIDSTVNLMRKDTTDIIINKTAFYCWGERYL
ncbi:MAG TPA: hypothetical protein PLZ84_06940, partial [Clostridia bacterium]|nr:hypothetical protein [Clostridia bacterium]